MAGKSYTGRLAFDPETGFHTEMVTGKVNVPVQLEDGTWGNAVEETLVPGKPVVTDDDGATWRYATDEDTPHNERYQQAVAAVDSTANLELELQLEHGREKAEQILREDQPHHFEVQPGDPHFGGIRSDPDHVAETVTSHTEAYGG
jgi:hypothetical protein